MPRIGERLNGVPKERAAKTPGLVVGVYDQDIQFRQDLPSSKHEQPVDYSRLRLE
jgi:hypothetical protein